MRYNAFVHIPAALDATCLGENEPAGAHLNQIRDASQKWILRSGRYVYLRVSAFWILVTAASLGGLLGCSKSLPARAPSGIVSEFADERTEGPLRLVRLHQAALEAAQRPALSIPPEAWHQVPYKDPTGEQRACLRADVPPFAAEAYNQLRIRLKSAEAKPCTIAWISDLEPSLEENPGLVVALYGEGPANECVVPLGPSQAETWLGEIRGLAIIAQNSVALPEIESLTLEYVKPVAPRRTTIQYVTHEALFGSIAPWKMTVPKDAVFETQVGFLPRAWETPGADGARFRVSLQRETGPAVMLLESDVNPAANAPEQRWLSVSADLAPYAGEKVALSLQVLPHANATRDYAMWGNPLVFSRAAATKGTPVILISCDTLRADHVSCYGYARETTPNIDAFAAEAALFENAVTPETWTLTAHLSMLTGLHPRTHGVTANTNLAESITTLPEALADANYLSAGFVGHEVWMLPWRGLAYGFDTYVTPKAVCSIFDSAPLVYQWLDSHETPQFFLFWHNYDLHTRFAELGCKDCDRVYYPPDDRFLHFSKDHPEPPTVRDAEGKRGRGTDLLWTVLQGKDSLTQEELDSMIALYDDSIRGVDSAIGEFFADLKKRGLYDNALIIVVADHGEHFGEHGQYLHQHIYEGALHVPLIVKFPKGEHAGVRYSPMVRLEDLMPTVLDVLGLPSPESDGQSLRAMLRGTVTPSKTAYAQRFAFRAVRNSEWKFIRDLSDENAPELYKIATDPKETENLYESAPDVAGQLNTELETFFLVNPEGWHIAFESPDPNWRGTLTATTTGKFETSKLLKYPHGTATGRPETLTGNEQKVTVTLGVLPMDELLLRTEQGDSPILVSIECESEFTVVNGASQAANVRHYQCVLDESQAVDATPQVGASGAPLIRIWHQDAPQQGTDAQTLTDEQREQLGGLGYGKSTDRSPDGSAGADNGQ